MKKVKTVALVAHDNRKQDLIEWAEWNYNELVKHKIVCTGTTGNLVEKAIHEKLGKEKQVGFKVQKLKSGPLGGDQQLGALIAEGKIDVLIFFWDPMEPQPHDVDVKALLRISVLYNIPSACNRSTADFIISSSLLQEDYVPILKDYSSYIKRDVNINEN